MNNIMDSNSNEYEGLIVKLPDIKITNNNSNNKQFDTFGSKKSNKNLPNIDDSR